MTWVVRGRMSRDHWHIISVPNQVSNSCGYHRVTLLPPFQAHKRGLIFGFSFESSTDYWVLLEHTNAMGGKRHDDTRVLAHHCHTQSSLQHPWVKMAGLASTSMHHSTYVRGASDLLQTRKFNKLLMGASDGAS